MRISTVFRFLIVLLMVFSGVLSPFGQAQGPQRPELKVVACDDFELTGDGRAEAWKKTDWVPMHVRPKSAHNYKTQFKMLYSKTGLYVLFSGEDRQITATKTEDFLDLWTEDVYECFFWTDERFPVYFEYEISPLGYELPILIPNFNGKFLGWRPWHIGKPSQERLTRRAVASPTGAPKSGAETSSWTAEVFIPYDLLKPLTNVPPKSGTKWRGNFYRMDYDGGRQGSWDWSRVGDSFHEFQAFGTLTFQ